jgi:hypothetical protein
MAVDSISNKNYQSQPINLAFPNWPTLASGRCHYGMVRQLAAAESSISEHQGHGGNAQRGQDSGGRVLELHGSIGESVVALLGTNDRI